MEAGARVKALEATGIGKAMTQAALKHTLQRVYADIEKEKKA